MFTNWLTGTTGGTAANQNSSDNRNGPPNSNPPNCTDSTTNGHILLSTPPDVILEVGPAPSTVRFVAHSIVLGMHSGYLRSAIRLDERNATTPNTSPDFVLYLGNVTAEQFAPLLTYMYTGYLDLNIENIFGVLLATHVLHMPRALEFCRAFLARPQAEGYLGSRLNSLNVPSSNGNCNGKIIRPIPSKPALPNFGFLPTSMSIPPATTMTLAQQQQQQQQQQLLANFKGLQRPNVPGYPTPMGPHHADPERQHLRAHSEEIDVDQESTHSPSDVGNNPRRITEKHEEDDDEDEEVFIDSSNTDSDNDEKEVIIECRSKSVATEPEVTKSTNTERSKHNTKGNTGQGKAVRHRNNSVTPTTTASARRDKRRNLAKARASSSGLQIAKAPIPASQLDVNEGSKVIIDVASCDGPVRFRRILNTAYGHKPEDFAPQMPERSQQSVSYSFHQQMARTINQQRQQLQQQSGGEESENSESSSSGCKNPSKTSSGEIYVCVYCKHTFKSQYCYQKHAKRHLNPLSLSATERCNEKSTLNGTFNGATFPHNTGGVLPMPLATTKQSATELLRREVRPLDMNVQYYPCKTCGSKFPSYYFVHKHRKMCHADEETAGGKDNIVQGSVSGTNADGDDQGEEQRQGNEAGSSGGDSAEHEGRCEN